MADGEELVKPNELANRERDLAAADRRPRVLRLKIAGMSLRRIGTELGVSHETVRNDLKAALEELREERSTQAELYRALETARLEELLSRAWALTLDERQDNRTIPRDPAVKLRAIREARATIVELAKLNGLNVEPDDGDAQLVNIRLDLAQLPSDELMDYARRFGVEVREPAFIEGTAEEITPPTTTGGD